MSSQKKNSKENRFYINVSHKQDTQAYHALHFSDSKTAKNPVGFFKHDFNNNSLMLLLFDSYWNDFIIICLHRCFLLLLERRLKESFSKLSIITSSTSLMLVHLINHNSKQEEGLVTCLDVI